MDSKNGDGSRETKANKNWNGEYQEILEGIETVATWSRSVWRTRG